MDIINRAQRIKTDQNTEDAKKRELFVQSEEKAGVQLQESDANIAEFIQLMENNSVEKTELFMEIKTPHHRRRKFSLLGYGWILRPYYSGTWEKATVEGIFLLSDGRAMAYETENIKTDIFSKPIPKPCYNRFNRNIDNIIPYFVAGEGLDLLASAAIRYGIV